MFRRSVSSLAPLSSGSRALSLSYVSSTQRVNTTVWRSYAKVESEEEVKKRKEAARAAMAAKGLLELTLSAPYTTYHDGRGVKMVTIPARSGRMGVLAKHVPVITPLNPGLVTVKPEEGKDEHYFISGGFATVYPDSVCCINSPEIVPIDQLNIDAAKKGVEEYTKRAQSNDGGKQGKAVAEICLNVYKEMVAAAELASKSA